jgi:nucleoside-triphosphatase
MFRIAIIGSPGTGKSTLCCKVLEKLTCTYGGMISADVRVKGERIGFEIRDITRGKQGILAHSKGSGPRVGKYHVNLEDLDNIGAEAIRNAISSRLIVIDEIAPMEFKSQKFIKAVQEALPMEMLTNHAIDLDYFIFQGNYYVDIIKSCVFKDH